MRQLFTVATRRGRVTIIHDAQPEDIAAIEMRPGGGWIVRPPEVRRNVLRALAADPSARVTLALAGSTFIGRATIGPSFGRWRSLPHVREFAYEVAREWRHAGLGAELARVALADPAVANEIVLALLWPSAWDVPHEALSPATYRQWLATAAGRGGFVATGTDEPEVVAEWAGGARLYVRVGERVPEAALAAFDAARYLEWRPHGVVAA